MTAHSSPENATPGFLPDEAAAIKIVHQARDVYENHHGDGAWVTMELEYVKLISEALRIRAQQMPDPALGIVRSAYYAEATGPQEEAWNAACEHIEEGLLSLTSPESQS